MPDDKRSELIRRLTEEIRADVEDENVQRLSDEALAELGEAYLEELESLEHERGLTLEELLEEEPFDDEWAEDADYAGAEAEAEAGEEIPDDDDRYVFEGSG